MLDITQLNASLSIPGPVETLVAYTRERDIQPALLTNGTLPQPLMSVSARYLTNEEIGKEVTNQVETMEDDVLLTEQAA
jgi:hypothetical protein